MGVVFILISMEDGMMSRNVITIVMVLNLIHQKNQNLLQKNKKLLKIMHYIRFKHNSKKIKSNNNKVKNKKKLQKFKKAMVLILIMI